jgi:hypothetical protein
MVIGSEEYDYRHGKRLTSPEQGRTLESFSDRLRSVQLAATFIRRSKRWSPMSQIVGTNTFSVCFSCINKRRYPMKKFTLLTAGLLLAASGALAQSQTPSTSQTTPAVNTEQNPGAPVAGKNSFTEDQAKSRIEEAGYTDVTGLKLDDQGVWRATASKDGKTVNVSLDFQGNVTLAK